MSIKSGYAVFMATPEMAKQMPKIFKAGATYVAQRAAAVDMGSSVRTSANTPKAAKKKAKKKVAKAAKKTKKVTKATKKATVRKPLKPEIVIAFVNSNEGCNMTDIERSVKRPQAMIRRALNEARESGAIRTEGQRRGLRYFAAMSADSTSSD